MRLSNGKTVKNINDYRLQIIKQANTSIRRIENVEQRAIDSSQTSVKTVLHIHHDESQTICQASDNCDDRYQNNSIFQNTSSDRSKDLLNLYHAHHSMITPIDTLTDSVFSPVESLQGSCNSYTVSKYHFKPPKVLLF